ncbi:uncharacterized protein LOC128171634 [Crassostrea angulata]|uniref:uncharacterized protein LOC128171634 n=1 Tax=Magallana angulata TaxID=2784310 RepID=UPI0022B14306|nr:uncharacterized protein LOC128171634 [Crassostrea angulata]
MHLANWDGAMGFQQHVIPLIHSDRSMTTRSLTGGTGLLLDWRNRITALQIARMADVLELSVEQEEIEELFGKSFPREWPSDGQACSIPSCPSEEHVFHKIGSYRAHFIKYHKELVPVYYCSKEGCSFRAFKITPIRKHWEKKHPGVQGCILCRNIKNPRYCDPGQIVMPLPTIHTDARDRAAEARRRASASTTPLFNLPR